MADPLFVEVVSADRRVWEGNAVSVIARTTEGDIGILSHHEPFLAILVPCAAEIIGDAGSREIVAVDGGFISVSDNRVSIIAQYATLAREITLSEAERELATAEKALNEGQIDDDTWRHFHRASAQVKAAQKVAERR